MEELWMAMKLGVSIPMLAGALLGVFRTTWRRDNALGVLALILVGMGALALLLNAMTRDDPSFWTAAVCLAFGVPAIAVFHTIKPPCWQSVLRDFHALQDSRRPHHG